MIERFEFTDRETDWHLRPTSFGPINLLVGVSGVGKSRTLQALEHIARCGSGEIPAPPNSQWSLRINGSGRTFDWTAETGERDANIAIDDESPRRMPKTRFLSERVVSEDGKIIASRDGDRVEFGKPLGAKLKETESIISLFQKEGAIAPLYENLAQVFTSSSREFDAPTWWPRSVVQRWQKEITSIEQLRSTRIPLLVRFDLLQIRAPRDYEAIVSSFTEIFETVKTVRVGWVKDLIKTNVDEDDDRLVVIIEEQGINKPIQLPNLSSGMRRTLRHLVELALAPSGSTILIDEYENSLGVNCLPSITRHLLNRTRDIQLIATSHHPYVINNIALEHWRVVARQGSEVEIVEAAAIPELQTASRQEAFIRLMNSETYRHGVSNL